MTLLGPVRKVATRPILAHASLRWPATIWAPERSPQDPILEALLDMARWQVLREPGKRARTNRPIKGPRQAVPLPSQPLGTEPDFVFSTDGVTSFARKANAIDLADLVFAHPRRSFSRRHGQHHKPIAQFSRVVGDLVMCESRLERSFVLSADHTPLVAHIVSQPMTIMFPVDSPLRHHTPDFLVLRHGHPPIVIDVKREDQALLDSNVRRHQVVAAALSRAGMVHVVWTGISTTIAANLDLLWGATSELQGFELWALEDIAYEMAGTNGMQAGQIASRIAEHFGGADAFWLTMIRQMIWDHMLQIDWNIFFTPQSRVWAA